MNTDTDKNADNKANHFIDISNIDELKRAIITSEILTRKY